MSEIDNLADTLVLLINSKPRSPTREEIRRVLEPYFWSPPEAAPAPAPYQLGNTEGGAMLIGGDYTIICLPGFDLPSEDTVSYLQQWLRGVSGPALRATADTPPTGSGSVRFWEARGGGTGKKLAVEVTKSYYDGRFRMPAQVRI